MITSYHPGWVGLHQDETTFCVYCSQCDSGCGATIHDTVPCESRAPCPNAQDGPKGKAAVRLDDVPTLCGISPRTDASNVAEPNLEAGLNLQAMEGEADLATARRVSRVLEHDDPK